MCCCYDDTNVREISSPLARGGVLLTLMFPSSPRCCCYVDTNAGVTPLARGVVVMLTLMLV